VVEVPVVETTFVAIHTRTLGRATLSPEQREAQASVLLEMVVEAVAEAVVQTLVEVEQSAPSVQVNGLGKEVAQEAHQHLV
jgi:hypothetical protein